MLSSTQLTARLSLRARRSLLLGLAAVTLAAAPSPASAVTVRTGSATGTILPIGSQLTDANSGNVTITGTFFGINMTITCTAWNITSTILANPSASGAVWMTVDTMTCTGASSPLKNPCSVTVNDLSWDPVNNAGGIEAPSTTTARLGTGTAGSIDISDCLARSAGSCLISGLTAGPINDGSYSLRNYNAGSWTNPNGTTSPPQLVLSNATMKANSSCSTTGTATFNGKFTVRESGSGLLVYLG